MPNSGFSAAAPVTRFWRLSDATNRRGTLEAITVDKGETTGGLADRLKKLAASGVLQPTLVDWAKEVRLVGNAGAHFDPIDSVSRKTPNSLMPSCGSYCGTSTNCPQS